MSKTAKIIIGVVVVILVILAITLTGKKDTDGETIKIGYFGPFTGLLAASTGESVGDGFKLAESQRNAFERNTLHNMKVEVIYEDDACDAKKAVSAAQKLIDVDKVKILVSGVCSASTLAVAPIAEQNKIILITPTSASPKITTAGDYIFRLSSPTTGMVREPSRYLTEKGYTKVALLFENNEYPAGWKDSFIEAFPGEVIVEGIAPGSTDVKSQLLKLSQSKPQAYVFTAISPATANVILKQFKELGLKGEIVGNDTFSLKVVHQTPDAEGIVTVTYSYDLASSAMQEFLSAYQEKYNRLSKEEIYAALGFDTYNALFESIEACDGDDSECIKTKLYERKNIDGVSGIYSIDQNGDTQRSFTLRKVTGGKLVEVK